MRLPRSGCPVHSRHFIPRLVTGCQSISMLSLGPGFVQRQNTTARNSHTVMKIDMESEGRYINPPPLEAKINQASFNRQRDYWASKSYHLMYIWKPGAGQHHLGYGEGQIEVQEVILRQSRGEFISIADWRKFWKELDTDLKLDTVRLQSPVSDSEEQGKEKGQSTAFGIIQERDTDRMIDQIQEEITRIFSLGIIIEMISDRKVEDKEEEEEITEEEVIEEIDAVVTDTAS
ncbi:MAG: hypothetical protein EZS28_042130 [Streblomastix strix]|uniref:Uncharacterized protein n=1 Tax=Streblomastix strix TaxID=222440 RepID=A0A5J4TVP6_9EUKA|nr:MAG: hypothetical protein EZS28_042130 [Streblomastix strix]